MKALRMLMYPSLCFWPLAHLQSEDRRPFKTSSICSGPLSWDDLTLNWTLVPSEVSPLPKCRHTKASPRIIWPHRSIHPHPVSDVGPVPPATQESGMRSVIRWKAPGVSTRSLTETFPYLPIGGKFFLYVNHSREVTSDKISSFSTWKETTISQYTHREQCITC